MFKYVFPIVNPDQPPHHNYFQNNNFKYLFLTLLQDKCFYVTVVPLSCSVNCKCHYKYERKSSVLDCSDTGMTSLSHLVVPKGTNWLIAKGNKIHHLQWSDKLHKVKHINLANSSIYSISPNFFSKLFSSTKVKYLNLAGNKLKRFNQDIQKRNLSKMFLSDNPIECNCDMFWFVEWLNITINRPGRKVVKDYKDIRCVGGVWNDKQVYKLT